MTISPPSSLSTLSPLTRSQAHAQAPTQATGPTDSVELNGPAEARLKQKGSKWKKAVLGTTLGLSAISSVGAMTGPGQVLIQQIFHPPAQAQSLVSQLHGYAGESATTDRAGVIQGLQSNIDLLDSPSGHDDGLIGIADLARVAAAPNAAAAARDSAQAVLADPVLLDSLDVATGGKVDHVISLDDLNQAWQNEQGSDFGTFEQMRSMLQTKTGDQSAFDYFDGLGGIDHSFSLSDLNSAVNASDTPDPFQLVAQDLLANPNYMNGFDVASASNSTGFFSNFNDSNYRDGVVSAGDLENIAYSPLPEVGRQFDDSDQAALDQVLSGDAKIDSNLFQSFFQTNRGNCASTAAIKAAMNQFGSNLFEQVDKQPDGSYNITMKDGFELNISPSELEASATATHFGGNDRPTKSLATLSYAAMAKRAWAMGNEGAQTYGQALLSLNDGEVAGNVPTYLGLEHHVHFIDVKDVAHYDGAVVSGNGHAYFVDRVDGQMIGDKWGTATPYQGKVHIDEGANQHNAYVLRP